MPALTGGDRFHVGLVEADEVQMMREGWVAGMVAGVWEVSELRKLDGAMNQIEFSDGKCWELFMYTRY